jgi:tetratricopeptide (TPR) repeat protein
VWKLAVEKVPLLLLSGASCLVTLLVQKQAMNSGSFVPLWVRGYTAIVSCAVYIKQMFWPVRLAVFYPYPVGALSIWPWALAAAVLTAVTVAAVKGRQRHPYFITGWLWYLVMLVPVIGLVQVGIQARADRYTYLPQIGLYLAVTWGVTDFCATWRHRRGILWIAGVVTIAALSWRTWIQTSYWKSSDSIWAQAVAATSNNVLAHGNLAFALLKQGRFDDAIPQFEQTLKLSGGLDTKPRDALVANLHYGLANALLQNGAWDEATFQYSKVMEWDPGYRHVELNLGTSLLRAGRTDEAIAVWQKALAAHRDEVEVHAHLGYALLVKGLPGEAIAEYERALQIAPQSAGSLNDLAWVLATCSDSRLRDGSRAVDLAQRADQLSGGKNPVFIRTLAAAYAEVGRFQEAADAAQRALELARAQSDLLLRNQLQADMNLYRMGRKPADNVSVGESARH